MKPILLNHTRVWRTYLGGKSLDEMEGKLFPLDANYPEDWLASVVQARNSGREAFKTEGLSAIAGSDNVLLKELIELDSIGTLGYKGVSMGFLAKLIDSSERLTIQVHPTREKAKDLFGSPYGKTESWFVLGSRSIEGEIPSVYLGFKPGITQERWKTLCALQDTEGMLESLHRFDIHVGDCILVPGGIPHAIGAGCFLLELQEPTDYTIRVERITPSGLQVADFQCHQGLGFERMFECFDYVGLDRAEAKDRYFMRPEAVHDCVDRITSTLIPYERALYFSMEKHVVSGKAIIPVEVGICSVIYVVSGNAVLNGMSVAVGDRLFVPSASNEVTVNGNVCLLQCFGPPCSH